MNVLLQVIITKKKNIERPFLQNHHVNLGKYCGVIKKQNKKEKVSEIVFLQLLLNVKLCVLLALKSP